MTSKIENKRILLICRERMSYPFFFLATQLQAQGNTVGFFFASSFEGFYNKSRHNKHTYFYAKDNFDDIYDLNKATSTFLNRSKNVDMDVDKSYCDKIDDFYPIRKQFLFEQNLCSEFHFRFQNNNISDNEKLFWLESVYKNTHENIKDFNPDLILDLENVTITRLAIKYNADKLDIPYIGINYPRYKDYIIPSFNLSIENDEYLYERYNKLTTDKNSKCQDYLNYYREKKEILPEKFKNSITDYKYDYVHGLKTVVGSMLREFDIEITSGNLKKKNYKFNLPLFENPFKKVLFHIKYEIKRMLSFNRAYPYFENPIENEKYIYYPLHLIPESTTFIQAPMFVDELSVIRNISKSLPFGIKLYVKEHPAMCGERPISFYNEVNKLTNIRLIKLSYYSDPKPLIEKSLGVITIAGSSALEAVMLNRPAMIFGNVSYSLIDSILKNRSFEELSTDIKKMIVDDQICDDEIVKYFMLIEDVGVEIRLAKMVKETETAIVHKRKIMPETEFELQKLMTLFEKGLEIYEHQKS